MIFILLCYPPAQLDHPQRSNPAPPTLLTSRASSPLPPASHARVFGWLLCLTGGHLRPRRFFSFFYLVQFASRNEETPPPTRSAPVRLLSNAPPTVDTNFRLVVVSPHKRRPSKAMGPPISLLVFVHQLTTKATIGHPPARFSPVVSPLRCPPYWCH